MTVSSYKVEGKPRTNFLVYAAYFGWACLGILVIYYSISGFTEKADDVQIYWQTDSVSDYSEADSSMQCAILDSEWHTYRFFMGDDPVLISHLRLDFVHENVVASTAQVRNLKLTYAANDNPGGVSSVAANMTQLKCSSCRFTQMGEQIVIDQIEFDPFIEFEFEPISAQKPASNFEISSERDSVLVEPVSSGSPVAFVELDLRIEPRKLNPLTWIYHILNESIFYPECASRLLAPKG